MKIRIPGFCHVVLSGIIFCGVSLYGQNEEQHRTAFHPPAYTFDRQDTLRGTITPERAWWDLVYYDLDVRVDIENRFISGTNEIRYRVLEPALVMQIDLQQPLEITSIEQQGIPLEFTREGNVFFVRMNQSQEPGEIHSILVTYQGIPRAAVRAPWDGGFSWKEDKNGNPFVATSNQGLGASVRWPCKDHMYDEPDSMRISITVPEGLMAVANGQLTGKAWNRNSTVTWQWEVKNPINNYGVNVNIGDYAHFSEVYQGEKGPLQCDYYVLRYNLDKAKEHFVQVPQMLGAFEYWFGPYPFYEDGYKLVEVPYLGMEHQSSVTYGNHYQNGYLGRDLSGTGWGLKFDFIIIHESGHEWFANSITYRDIADMWIHESFTNYSEGLFVEYHYGKQAGYEYLRGIRRNILNDIPVIGVYGVNHEGSGDMYAKVASMLHTIRQLVNDDEKWRGMLRGLNRDFYHSTVTTEEIEQYMIEYTGLDLQPVFDQYLRTVLIPTLEYYFEGAHLYYRWINAVSGFNMPVKVRIGGRELELHPDTSWGREACKGLGISADHGSTGQFSNGQFSNGQSRNGQSSKGLGSNGQNSNGPSTDILTIHPDYFVGAMQMIGD
ncbi:MAG: M1 family metallopeptidase [Bacteroidales bacterium]|nr:M1 family metallopeptidase [Bacteroidales bacterium]